MRRTGRDPDPGWPSYHRVGGRANGDVLALGLISGTSMDGVDAALVRVAPGGEGSIRCVAHDTRTYDPELREALRGCVVGGQVGELARLDVVVGEVFAEAAMGLLEATAVAPGDVTCIGSHGQTLVHLPRPGTVAGRPARATLQIGDPAVIAVRTGITTVADFRSRDVALGGEGAPLVPLLDYRLYRSAERGRLLLNLGGIANVTLLPAGAARDDVLAFDTGPGNVLLDEAARRRGLPGFDTGGERAAGGSVQEPLLEIVLDHPFFDEPPPRSADTGEFLAHAERVLWPAAETTSTEDLLRTLCAVTAVSVARSVGRWGGTNVALDEVLVSGGGLHNRVLMSELEERLAPLPLRSVEEVAELPSDAKEAAAFALLAVETLAGRPGNLPLVTGASRPAVLGSIVPGAEPAAER